MMPSMPDLTVIHYRGCQDLDYFQMTVDGSKGNKYVVSCNRGRWSCDCKGFKFRKTCKHVEEAQKNKCGWSQEWNDEEAVVKGGDYVCPKCGGETFVYKSMA
jgi:hypothetical protein